MAVTGTPDRHAFGFPVRRVLLGIVMVIALAAVLAYLRDPPWLIDVTSGLSAWEIDERGTRYRWTSGHSSFFVPSDSRYIVLTMRAVRDTPGDWPIIATVTIDDRPAQQVEFDDEAWRVLKLVLPRRGSRAVRRIDIKLNRLRGHQRGLQLQSPDVH